MSPIVLQTEQDVADWTTELFAHLNITKASLVGYSLGSFLASCVAMKAPSVVDKVVLIAPAGVFAPIELGWIFRAITFGVLSNIVGWESPMADQLRNWFFGYMTTVDPAILIERLHPELRQATDKAGPAQVGVRPVAYSVESLREMNENTPTLLIIGEEETVINGNVAIETAKAAGIEVKAYPNASHMLFAEYPRDNVIEVVDSFLAKK